MLFLWNFYNPNSILYIKHHVSNHIPNPTFGSIQAFIYRKTATIPCYLPSKISTL